MRDVYRRTSMGVLLVAVFMIRPTAVLFAQQGMAEFELAEQPRLTIGTAGTELYRVRGAAILPDGAIAIADAGNRRILIVSPQGVIVSQMGRRGQGPAEFEDLTSLTVFGDTLVAYDAVLSRMSIWTEDGSWIGSINLPEFEGRSITVRAVLSPRDYVATSRNGYDSSEHGRFTDRVALLRVDGATGLLTVIRSMDWQHLFTYRQPNAYTVYLVPFMGETVVAGTADQVAIVPLDSASVYLMELGEIGQRRISLPDGRRPFDPSLIEAHRDSLLEGLDGSGAQAAAVRIRQIFGRDFPKPTHVPSIQSAVAVGRQVWLRRFRLPREADAVWYIIDVEIGDLIGRAVLPKDWQVLGGDERSVVVLRRDALDAEYVTIYDRR